jgi:maltose alpha-D-glucosyltransferase/alpha-amylase
MTDPFGELLASMDRDRLAATLLQYVQGRRWFRSKSRRAKGSAVTDLVRLDAPPDGGVPVLVAMLQVRYEEGAPELYVVPLCIVQRERADDLEGRAVVSPLESGAALVDGLFTGDAAQALFAVAREQRTVRGEKGELRGSASSLVHQIVGREPLSVIVPRAEQTNSTLVLGERVLFKIYRQLTEGENPEIEIGRFLAAHGSVTCTPRVLGELSYLPAGGAARSLGIAHEFWANDGDAWTAALADVRRWFDEPRQYPAMDPADGRLEALLARATRAPDDGATPAFAVLAETLGRRTGELHLALASDAVDPAFAPEPLSPADRGALAERASSMLEKTMASLAALRDRLSADARPTADRILDAHRRHVIAGLLAELRNASGVALKIRTHGDLHLGQVLVRGDDVAIIDFEGEPARPLSERRAKSSPFRDVTGMLRSFDYAPEAVLRESSFPGTRSKYASQARLWTRDVSVAYLRGYLATVGDAPFVPAAREDTLGLLTFHQLEKVIYEIAYELDHRPDWLPIPLRGLLTVLALESA